MRLEKSSRMGNQLVFRSANAPVYSATRAYVKDDTVQINSLDAVYATGVCQIIVDLLGFLCSVGRTSRVTPVSILSMTVPTGRS